MSLLWMEGFELWEDARYTDSGGTSNMQSHAKTTYTRWVGGTGCGFGGGYGGDFRPYFEASTTIILGVAINKFINTGLGSGGWKMEFKSGNDVLAKLYSNASTILFADSAGTVHYSSGVTAEEWNYWEIQITVGESSTAIINYNETEILNVTNADLSINGATTCNNIEFTAAGFPGMGYWAIDDVYIANSLGDFNNEFFGDTYVQCLTPDSAGDASDWTPSSGTAHGVLTDEDTATYVAGTVENDTILSNLSDIDNDGLNSSIRGIVISYEANYNGTHPMTIDPVVKNNGTVYDAGAEQVLTTARTRYDTLIELNPETESPWTEEEVNALQVGMKVVSHG